MKKIFFLLLFLIPASLWAQADKTSRSPEPPHDCVFYLGLGGGTQGLAADAAVFYKWIGIGATASFAESLSAPATTSGIDNTQFGEVTSVPKKYDNGSVSYDLFLRLPIGSVFSIEASGGYYLHTWQELTTTTDNQGILSPSVKQTGTGTYQSGISWGAGVEFNTSNLIMIGARYSSIGSAMLNVGYRF
jgi:opacity protein-like surface antigen